MSMIQPVKVLVVGSALGSIRDLFSKIKAIDAKHGKFELALCIGSMFGPVKEEDEMQTEEDEVVQLLSGKIEAPMSCYIMQGDHALPQRVIAKFAKTGGELCPNVFLLNKSGIITTAHGLRIACLGGTYNPDVYDASDVPIGFSSPYFTSFTVEKLISNTFVASSQSEKRQNNKNNGSLASILSSSATSQLVDILISNVWPSTIINHSAVILPSPELLNTGTSPIDELVRRTKPRYHFTSSGGQPPKFWEREPFVWDEEGGRISRFVSLGAFGGEPEQGAKKQRWFYAFSIAPMTATTSHPSRPANATKNPFTEDVPRLPKRPLPLDNNDTGENYIWGNVPQPRNKRTRTDHIRKESGELPPAGYTCKRCEGTDHFFDDCPERAKPPEGYICKICQKPGHFVRDCPTKHAVGDTGGRKPKAGYICRACASELHFIEDCPMVNEKRGMRREPPKEISPDECWFCLSNPNLVKHLIISIGSETYVTLPKGQIPPAQSGDQLLVPGGGHVLIVPITHYPTLTTIPDDLAPPIIDEVEKYKTALRSCYAKYGAAAVIFEVGRISGKGGHAHIQVVPIPIKLQDKVEEAFLNEGKFCGMEFEADVEGALAACEHGQRPYFKVDLPDGRKMVHLVHSGRQINLQFGRQVLVSLMNIPERLDWKACAIDEDSEKADAQAFKIAFAPFDPTT